MTSASPGGPSGGAASVKPCSTPVGPLTYHSSHPPARAQLARSPSTRASPRASGAGPTCSPRPIPVQRSPSCHDARPLRVTCSAPPESSTATRCAPLLAAAPPALAVWKRYPPPSAGRSGALAAGPALLPPPAPRALSPPHATSSTATSSPSSAHAVLRRVPNARERTEPTIVRPYAKCGARVDVDPSPSPSPSPIPISGESGSGSGSGSGSEGIGCYRALRRSAGCASESSEVRGVRGGG